jgi:hypothetical protein
MNTKEFAYTIYVKVWWNISYILRKMCSIWIGTKYFKGIYTGVLKMFQFELKEWISGWMEIKLWIILPAILIIPEVLILASSRSPA